MTIDFLPLLDSNQPSRPTLHNPNYSLDGFPINNNLRFVRKIGAGTYGLIYLVENTTTGLLYAAKMVLTDAPVKNGAKIDVEKNKLHIQRKLYDYFSLQPNNILELDLTMLASQAVMCPFLREIALHLRVHNHPNVVTIHHVFNLGRLAVMTLMDYYEQGDLFANIIDNKTFTNPPVHQDKQLLMKNCMLQLIDVINYCACNGVYHCDLKPENVMVHYNRRYRRTAGSLQNIIDYNELQIALTDFGLAMTSETICCNACRGLSFYMAPERIVNYNTNALVKLLIDLDQYQTMEGATLPLCSKYFPTLAGDIWLLGVLFINITCARNPWPIANINEHKEVFTTYMLKDKDLLSQILPILKQFNRLLDEIFTLGPNERIPLVHLFRKITECDFFNDDTPQAAVAKADFNEQLFTPPYTDSDHLEKVPSYFSIGEYGNAEKPLRQAVKPKQTVCVSPILG